MSNGPQASAAVAYAPRLFESNSSLPLDSSAGTTVSVPSVLLVGRNGSWGSIILKSLAKFGSELSFAVPTAVTAKFARKGTFDLILLDSTVAAEQRRELAADLIGTATSLYYSFPVENGCWWLPTVRRRRACHGAPAFRRNEFPLELERVLQPETEG